MYFETIGVKASLISLYLTVPIIGHVPAGEECTLVLHTGVKYRGQFIPPPFFDFGGYDFHFDKTYHQAAYAYKDILHRKPEVVDPIYMEMRYNFAETMDAVYLDTASKMLAKLTNKGEAYFEQIYVVGNIVPLPNKPFVEFLKFLEQEGKLATPQ